MVAQQDAVKRYGVIYTDPPWKFATYSAKGKGRSAEAHYDCMSLDEIKSLDIPQLAAPDCVLFLWVTDPMLFTARDVIEAWGFEPKTVGFYWAKCGVDQTTGFYDTDVWPIGTGYWTRSNPEQCLLATRGHPRRRNADVRKLIVAPRREHSRKPDEIYGRIERLCVGPYLELFARFPRSGWDQKLSTTTGAETRRWKSNSHPTLEDLTSFL